MNKQAKRTPICVVFFLDFDFSEYKRKCKIEKKIIIYNNL